MKKCNNGSNQKFWTIWQSA